MNVNEILYSLGSKLLTYVITHPSETAGYVVTVLLWLAVIRVLLMFKTMLHGKFSSLATRNFPRAYEAREGATPRRFLVLGDSTAVGTGANRHEDTIAGRLAHDFPNASIINIAENGARTRDVLRQMRGVATETFDLIMVSTGGNDIWRLSELTSLTADLRELLSAARTASRNRVFLLLYSNIGLSPAFPFFLRPLINRHRKNIQRIFREVAAENGVPCIELFIDERDATNPFCKNPRALFARDRVHPNSEGYRLWYHRFWRLMVDRGYRTEFMDAPSLSSER